MNISRNNLTKTLFLIFLAFYFSACHHSKKIVKNTDTNYNNNPSKTEIVAGLLKMNEKDVKEKKLYRFVSDWYGTPYKYGGCDKKGTDCSCLAINLYLTVYEKKIPRTAGDIKNMCEKVSSSNVSEGDFIFFKIKSESIDHVGIVLRNNKFIHASTSRGVVINDVNEEYYKKYFYCYGRLK